jgi:aminoglycoside 2''-phosphotransferase
MEPGYDLLKHIRKRYPDLEIRSVRALDDYRQEHHVYVVNEAVVFRFPSTSRGVQALMREKFILSRIHAILPLPVPRPLYSSSGTEQPGEVFVGYHYIEGTPLTPQRLQSSGDIPHQRRLARQLGEFLKALHEYPVDFIGIHLPQYERKSDWQALYQSAREQIFPLLRPEVSRRFAALFEETLNDMPMLDFTPCLTHGRLEPYNVVYDEDNRQISGVVDFSHAGVGDPAADFAGLLVHGEEFLDWVSLSYPVPLAVHRRAQFIHAVTPLQEAVDCLARGDQAGFDRLVAALR